MVDDRAMVVLFADPSGANQGPNHTTTSTGNRHQSSSADKIETLRVLGLI
jgi:hypothetical protein